MTIRIIPAARDQAEYLSDLAVQSKSYWEYSATELEAMIPGLTITDEEMAAGGFFIALLGETIVGFYGLSPDNSREQLTFLFVDHRFIGQGIGSILWEHALNAATSRGWRRMRLYSDVYAADRFYYPRGLIKIGEILSPSGIRLVELEFRSITAGCK